MNEEHKIKAGIKNDTTPIRGNMTEDARPASTSARGIIRIATDEEALVGENTNTAITPYTLKKVNAENNTTIAEQINAFQNSEDIEMAEIIALIGRRTENMVNFLDE